MAWLKANIHTILEFLIGCIAIVILLLCATAETVGALQIVGIICSSIVLIGFVWYVLFKKYE